MGDEKKENADGLPEEDETTTPGNEDLNGLEAGTQVRHDETTQGLDEVVAVTEEAVPAGESAAPASATEEEIKADFQPFYEKEAEVDEKVRKISTVALYSLFAGLSLALAALVVDVLFFGTGFKLEITVAAVVCFALIGIFWKTISQESKAGMVALTIGIVLLWPRVMFIRSGQEAPWDFSADYMWPVFFLISLAAILLSIWLFWPKLGLIPALVSLPVIFVALAPVWALVENAATLAEVVEGPSLMETWPFYLRSGYLLMEVILPLGVLLLLVLQGKNLFRSHHKIHFGYLFWALFLVMASLIGFNGLEAQGRPSAVPFGRVASFGMTETEPASQPEKPVSAVVSKADTVSVAATDTEPDTKTDTTSDIAAASAQSTELAASTESESRVEQITPETKTLAQEPDPAIEANNQRIMVLEEKIKLLEEEILSLKGVVTSQKALVALLINFADKLKEKEPPPAQQETVTPKKTEAPAASDEDPPEPKPLEDQPAEPASPVESEGSN
ncbi:MAG: hypothetical protein JRD68_03680 [Deltaproteobacteria bacterium]|nr:hypothetical protein [Deltaproteobacteria bacterium]